MGRFRIRLFAIIFLFCIIVGSQAQTKRSEDFHDRYRLSKVVVLSRHNIRAPMSGPESVLARITPYEWHHWTSAPRELSLRGGVLETMMGQYFRKWLVSEGLMDENEMPTAGQMRFYANSMQRTIATAQYFSSGMLPVANASIEHHYPLNTMDPVFTPKITRDDEAFFSQVTQQILDLFGNGSIENIGLHVADNLRLMEEVLSLSESKACVEGDTCEFRTDNPQLQLVYDAEPRLKGGLSLACTAADALVLQYYEEPDDQKAAFGHILSQDDWARISEVKDWYCDVLFTAPLMAVNVAHPLLQEMLAELRADGRTFSFLCGHDSNIASVLAALRCTNYLLPDAIEGKTPIGVKLVVEQWTGSDGEEYAALNLVYQTVEQLRQLPLLSLDNPPACFSVQLDGLVPNADGLYLLADVEQRFAESIAAYDEAVPTPTTVQQVYPSVSLPTYDLLGRRIVGEDELKPGLYISGQQKVAR